MNLPKKVIIGASIVNENRTFFGWVTIENGLITSVNEGSPDAHQDFSGFELIDAKGLTLLPGVIDDQVHFRDPGLTYKGDLSTESKAAVAGGVTSFMDMPNTIPNCLTQELLEEKYKHAAGVSSANYSFYMGASNDNLDEVVKTNPANVCGIKVFMGSSTGNMLVDKEETLNGIFKLAPTLVAVHCEDEATILKNQVEYAARYDEKAPTSIHPEIRSEEACYLSSAKAVKLAKKNGTRLHILHLSTGREMELFDNKLPLSEKKITAEVCVHHLWFSDADYDVKGNMIKWNPAIKKASDREALLQAVMENKIDVIATDHAPHTLEEKERPYFKAPSGGPMVQHSLVAMLELARQGKISIEKVVTMMCHHPAELFRVNNRGYIRKGYAADLVLVDLNRPWTVTKNNVLYKCGWSPMEDIRFHAQVVSTFVNGQLACQNGEVNPMVRGERLTFNR
ncbi:MAG: dihydroorotase [Bacteroidales bacterium]|nr:dihydroorotase [Bacteroidales bacterium]